jgi:hypothetical protein
LLAPLWGIGQDARKAAIRNGLTQSQLLEEERPLEIAVSSLIQSMPFLWLEVGDTPGPESHRGVIERNSIGLLSAYRLEAIDPPSPDWLGTHCDRDRVRASGLWNNNHVDENYDPRFLDVLEGYVKRA